MKTRTTAVLNKVTDLLGPEVLRQRPIEFSLVRRWVIEGKTLSAVLLRFLAYTLDKEPRTIKQQLNLARKQDREASEHLKLLDERNQKYLVVG